MTAKVTLFKQFFSVFEEELMSFDLENLNGHNVDIKLSNIVQ